MATISGVTSSLFATATISASGQQSGWLGGWQLDRAGDRIDVRKVAGGRLATGALCDGCLS
jgi:hypothetical protein